MQRLFNRIVNLAIPLGLALLFSSSSAFAQYTLSNLVSNQAGQARNQDPLLVNAWGLAYSPGGAFWVSDEGTGWSTLYDGTGVPQSLQVVIPPATGTGAGSPTGMVYNASQEFKVKGWPSIFLFATLDGTISGWAPQSNPSESIIAVNNPGAVYTALAITSKTSGNFIFATDIANSKVDVYDGKFNFVTSFTDSTLPAGGFVPFGIQDIKGHLYVAFASASGGSGGVIDIFTEAGVLQKHLIRGNPLNQPWGFAMAPGNFGKFSGALLVSNNTDSGTINAFNAQTGAFLGTLSDSKGNPLVIDQLWGIEFGGGTASNGRKNQLFFTAGPNNNVNGLFGLISAN